MSDKKLELVSGNGVNMEQDDETVTISTGWFIQDTRQYLGNSLMWWRPNGKGYTANINEAGEYSEEEARKIVRNGAHFKAWPCSYILTKVTAHVDSQHIESERAAKW